MPPTQLTTGLTCQREQQLVVSILLEQKSFIELNIPQPDRTRAAISC